MHAERKIRRRVSPSVRDVAKASQKFLSVTTFPYLSRCIDTPNVTLVFLWFHMDGDVAVVAKAFSGKTSFRIIHNAGPCPNTCVVTSATRKIPCVSWNSARKTFRMCVNGEKQKGCM